MCWRRASPQRHFGPSPPGAGGEVRRTLGLPAEKRLLLYAPTFRKDKGLEAYDMDYARCVKALERRFGGEC